MTKIIAGPEGKRSTLSVLDNVVVLRDELHLAAADVLSLIYTYRLLEGAYYTLDYAAAEVLDIKGLSHLRQLFILWSPVFMKRLGWDERQRYLNSGQR